MAIPYIRKTPHNAIILAFWILLLILPKVSFGQESVTPIEINGDQVEFMMEDNKLVAEGNVVIKKDTITLNCDKVVFFRETMIAVAEGNVVLNTPEGAIKGDALTYNFGEMAGSFVGARVTAEPYYGAGDSIEKLGDNHIRMKEAYLTTCDLEKPHFRLISKKVDLYSGEKVVARNVIFYIGKIPVFYLPKYARDLRDQRQRVIMTPGYDKEWGSFLLQKWRYYFNEGFKGTVNIDYRERKDLAWGFDLDYKTKKTGEGIIKTYYMNERNITSKYVWQEKPSPTIEKERFKVEWRHKWKIDNKTDAIWQYYKIGDKALLKDYFEKEYEKDSNPDTFFLLTRTLPSGSVSFRTDARVNRFTSAVERLPELKYSFTNQEIGDLGVYLRSSNTFSNLTKRDPSPSEVRPNTMRVDSDNELSYPLKISFLELRPFVGGRNTYYSKTKDTTKYGVVRGMFKTGASLSTKFYKIVDITSDAWGIEINRLRHIITPSVSYDYTTDPSIHTETLDQFDSVDNISQKHALKFSLENKLQTKRDNKTVDLLRALVSSDFLLKENSGKGGFNTITTDFELKPSNWLTFFSDTSFDATKDKLTFVNFDIYLNDGDKWSFDLGKRYHVNNSDQITTEFKYKLNPKWSFRFYGRFDTLNGITREQEYSVTRDLHCWEMSVNFNETHTQGSEIWLVITLKAFPEIGFDFGTSFNKRKAGSQSSKGDY